MIQKSGCGNFVQPHYNRGITENNMRNGFHSPAQDVAEHWLRNHDVHYVDTRPVYYSSTAEPCDSAVVSNDGYDDYHCRPQ